MNKSKPIINMIQDSDGIWVTEISSMEFEFGFTIPADKIEINWDAFASLFSIEPGILKDFILKDIKA